MSAPIALGAPSALPHPLSERQNGDARSAPVSPDKREYKVDRSKANPDDVAAAEGFEAIFLDQMMQSMRKTIPKNEMDLESPATEIYRGMLDSEVAEKSAHQGGFGLADQIIAYLESQRYNLEQGPRPPSVVQGGTREGNQ